MPRDLHHAPTQGAEPWELVCEGYYLSGHADGVPDPSSEHLPWPLVHAGGAAVTVGSLRAGKVR